MPSTEAKLNRNRSVLSNDMTPNYGPWSGASAAQLAHSVRIPSFKSILMVRHALQPTICDTCKPDGAYLSCGFCQWTSHLCGMVGATSDLQQSLRDSQKGPNSDLVNLPAHVSILNVARWARLSVITRRLPSMLSEPLNLRDRAPSSLCTASHVTQCVTPCPPYSYSHDTVSDAGHTSHHPFTVC